MKGPKTMRNWIVGLLAVALCLTASADFAKGGKKAAAAADKGIKGKILSVSGDGAKIVLETKGQKAKGGAQGAAEQVTVAIADSTTIEINDVGGKHASDLRPGMRAQVKMTAGTATDIKATDHAKPHHKKTGAANAPAKKAPKAS